MIALGFSGALHAFGIACDLVAYARYPGFLLKEDYDDPGELTLVVVSGARDLGAVLLYAFTVIVFCVWIRRANATLHAAGFHGLRFTPGWAVGWWFVPFAHLYKPYEVMLELWRATTADRDDWVFAPRSPALPVWWGFWIVGNIIENTGARLSWRANSPEASATALGVSALGNLVALPAAALAAWIVWTIQAQIERKFATTPAFIR